MPPDCPTPGPDPAALQERLRLAEEAVRARDDFLATAAHELRSPLHALALRLAALERMAARDGAPALANLVANAIKYGNGTPVRLRAALDGPDRACFEVSDRGPGIAPQDRARIFARFERLVAGARERSGFGLGLWIVGRMVAAHGGSVEVDAAPGGGSLFRVLLPLQAPGAQDSKEDQTK